MTRQGVSFGREAEKNDIAEAVGSNSNKSTPIQSAEKNTPIMGGKSKRGRKPIKDDKYITESMIQIEKYEQEMKDKQDTMSDAEYKRLYSKMSALKSRVKRKREAMWQKQSLSDFNSKFVKLATIIFEEIDINCRDDIMLGLIQKKARVRRAADPHVDGTKVTKTDFVKKLKEYMDD